MKRNNKKGFTIVELVIVIAVIAILAGVLIPTFTGIIKKAQDSAILQEMRAALTVILAEEDSQMDADAQYVFIYAKDADELVYYEYDHTTKKLVKIVKTEIDVYDDTSSKLKPEAEDTVWYEKNNSIVVASAGVDGTNNPEKIELEDLDSIVVIKHVS